MKIEPRLEALWATCVAIVGGGRYRCGITDTGMTVCRGPCPAGVGATGKVWELALPPPETGVLGLCKACVPTTGGDNGVPEAMGSPGFGVGGQIGGGIDATNGQPGIFGMEVCCAIPPTNWVNMLVRWSKRVLSICICCCISAPEVGVEVGAAPEAGSALDDVVPVDAGVLTGPPDELGVTACGVMAADAKGGGVPPELMMKI